MVGRGIGVKAISGLGQGIAAAVLLLALAPLASASAAPPSVAISSPTGGSTTSQPAVPVTGSTDDSKDPVVVHIYQGEGTGGAQVQELESSVPSAGAWGVQSAAMADGIYTAVAQQLNSETLETGFSSAVTFTIDTVAPLVSLNPVASPSNDSTPTFTGAGGGLPGDDSSVAVAIYAGSVVAGTPVTTGHPTLSGGGWSYTPSSLTDGTYTAQASQGDDAGNVGASGSATFTVDTTAPAVTLNTVAAQTNSTTPSFSGAAGVAVGDLAGVVVVVHKGSSVAGPVAAEGPATVNGGGWTYTSSSQLIPDGSYTVQAIQRDQAGNEGRSSAPTFKVDTIAPSLSITSPKSGEKLTSSKPTFSGATNNASGEPLAVTIEVFTGPAISGSPVQTFAVNRSGSFWSTGSSGPRLANATYTVRVRQSDSAGNLGESPPVTFTVESPAPTVTLTGLPRFINNTQPSFSGSADTSEAEPKVTLKIWQGTSASGTLAEPPVTVPESAGAWSTATAVALPEGIYTAQAEQPAEEGNPAGVSTTTTFTVDTTAPGLTLSAPGQSSGLETVSGLAGAAPGDRRQITVELFTDAAVEPGQAFETITVNANEGAWSATFAGLASGEYTTIARQSDEAGNTGQSNQATFTVTAPTVAPPAASPSPPVASFTWVPASPTVGQSVSLVSNSTDASSPIGAFAWDLAGAGQFVGGGPLMTTSFATAGPHVVRLRVTDANGLSTLAARTINVTTPTPKLMQPFPIVRIAGSETSYGVKVRLLTVQTPLSTKVAVTCKGHGCKTKSESRLATSSSSSKNKSKAGTVMLAFQRFERPLRAGVVLQIRVTKEGQIGKYTRFTIRKHKLPLRSDSCLSATSPKPIACPTS